MTPFTIDNLPYGVVSTVESPIRRCAIAFEDNALDLNQLYGEGFFKSLPELSNVFANDNWNAFAALPSGLRASVRTLIKRGIQENNVGHALISLSKVKCHLPMDTRNYSDFYCSYENTKNCTEVMSLQKISPNWYAIPAVYNGRMSSLAVVSGDPVTRPYGMLPDPQDPSRITFQAEPHLDFELEMGVWLSKPVPRGHRLTMADAHDHIFGLTLLNDLSARRIQLFEMPPLGPFHSKGMATTVSPWVVPVEAMVRFQCGRQVAPPQDPPPPPHLSPQGIEAAQTYDIDLTVKLVRDGTTYTVCESNLNELYWTPLQQLVHLGSAGEGFSTGDVFGTGTISSSRTNADD